MRGTLDIIKKIWKYLINRPNEVFKTSDLAIELGTSIVDAYTDLEEYLERLEKIGVLEKESKEKWKIKDDVKKLEFIFSP